MILRPSRNSTPQYSKDRPILYVTCGDWDLKTMLPAQLKTSGCQPQRPDAFREWCNIKKVVGVRGLPDLMKKLELPLEGRHHSGLDDTRNIAKAIAELLKRRIPVEANGWL